MECVPRCALLCRLPIRVLLLACRTDTAVDMASSDADKLERGALLAADQDGELGITSSVTDAGVHRFNDRLLEAVPPPAATAKASKSVQFAEQSEPEPEPEPEPSAWTRTLTA